MTQIPRSSTVCVFVLLFVGCSGSSTQTPRDGTTLGDTASIGPGAPTVEHINLSCEQGQVLLEAFALGTPESATFWLADTASSTPRSEEHSLAATGPADVGTEYRRLLDSNPGEAWTPDETTGFSCVEDIEPGLMTMAVGLFDGSGAMLDCGVAGHAPEAFVQGDFCPATNSCSVDSSRCVVLVPAARTPRR